ELQRVVHYDDGRVFERVREDIRHSELDSRQMAGVGKLLAAPFEHRRGAVDADETDRRIGDALTQPDQRLSRRAAEIIDCGARLEEPSGESGGSLLHFLIQGYGAVYHVVEDRCDAIVENELFDAPARHCENRISFRRTVIAFHSESMDPDDFPGILSQYADT